MSDERVAIAGAGPAGLVAARHLAEGGVDVDVYEAAEAVGGRVRSREVDGFTLDRGFQVLLTGYPAVQRELDLDALDVRPFAKGAVLCRENQRSVLADPFDDPGSILETALNREVTLRDELRLWRLRRDLRDRTRSELFSGADRSTLETLLSRGFSDGFVESFARPFVGGFTLDHSLSTSSRVFEYVLKVIAAGETVLPADGMGAVAAQLVERAESAGAAIHADAPVEEVSPDPTGATLVVDGERVRADAAVVATDAPTARELTGVEAIPTEGRSCATQYYALPEHAAPDGRRLHLDAAGGEPVHVATLSNVAPSYAPDDRALLQATFLEDVDAPAAKLDDRTRRSLAAWYPERQFGEMELLATDRVEFAQFAQPPGIHEQLPSVDAPDGRCYLAGEYTRWSSLQAALESGRTAAQRALAEL